MLSPQQTILMEKLERTIILHGRSKNSNIFEQKLLLLWKSYGAGLKNNYNLPPFRYKICGLTICTRQVARWCESWYIPDSFYFDCWSLCRLLSEESSPITGLFLLQLGAAHPGYLIAIKQKQQCVCGLFWSFAREGCYPTC